MHNDIERILITEEEIRAKVEELGEILTEEYMVRIESTSSYGPSALAN